MLKASVQKELKLNRQFTIEAEIVSPETSSIQKLLPAREKREKERESNVNCIYEKRKLVLELSAFNTFYLNFFLWQQLRVNFSNVSSFSKLALHLSVILLRKVSRWSLKIEEKNDLKRMTLKFKNSKSRKHSWIFFLSLVLCFFTINFHFKKGV